MEKWSGWCSPRKVIVFQWQHVLKCFTPLIPHQFTNDYLYFKTSHTFYPFIVRFNVTECPISPWLNLWFLLVARKPWRHQPKCLVPVASTSTLPDTLDPLQFAYGQNRSTDDAVAYILHTVLIHLEQRNLHVTMLFTDYTSAFSTTGASQKVTEIQDLGFNCALCRWILGFLCNTTTRAVVKIC